MLDQAHIDSVKARHAAYESARREVITLSGNALAASKRAIFALHRDDVAGAEKLLADAKVGLEAVAAKAKVLPDIASEGSYRAGLEEFVEASLYLQYVRNGKVGAVAGEHIDHDIYLGGLSDLAGEILRRQVRYATERKFDDVKKAHADIEEIVGRLLEMDLGGYLRTKFDQAKNALRKAEEILYETTIRR